MDSSFFTLHLNSSLFTFFSIFSYILQKKTANVSLVFDIKVLSLLHTKI